MWTEITRQKYVREGQRYASNLTDAEWALIEPHMPAAKPLGRPRARPPGPAYGRPADRLRLGRKLVMLAHASISVPVGRKMIVRPQRLTAS
jgi:hypothetical protein